MAGPNGDGSSPNGSPSATGTAAVGIVDTVAGTGPPGFSGEGSLATPAQLNQDVVIERSGNVLVADLGNQRVRRVDAGGRIFTIAGIGTSGSSRDGGPAVKGRLNQPAGLAIDRGGRPLRRRFRERAHPQGHPDGTITTVAGPGVALFAPGALPPTLARLGRLAVDTDGNLVLADAGGNRVGRLPL